MSRSIWIKSALSGAFFASAMCAATPAFALDAGQCYSEAQVRAETWDAQGAAKHYTLLKGYRTNGYHPEVRLTSTRDGSLGFAIELSANGQMCITAKVTNVLVNNTTVRPSWVNLPAGSANETYISGQEQRNGTRIVIAGRSIINQHGRDYLGPQIVVTMSDKLIEGFNGGGAFTNDSRGEGELILSMMNVSTNPDLARFANAANNRTQVAALNPN